jgi:hypothetical protein
MRLEWIENVGWIAGFDLLSCGFLIREANRRGKG